MGDYYVGQTVRLKVEIRNDALALADPTSVVLTVQLPDLTTATPTVVNDSVGKYHADYVPAVDGPFEYHWHSTGTPQIDEGGAFHVDPVFGQTQVVSLDDVLAHLNWTSALPAGSTHADELQRMINAATVVIEGHPDYGIGPVLRRTISNERHHHIGQDVVWLRNPPILSVATVTPVATGGPAVTVADLDVNPNGAVRYLDGYTRFPVGWYKWTYAAGRATIDDAIAEAALEIVAGLWETQRGAAGLPIIQATGGEFAQVPGMGPVMWRVAQLLAPYKRISLVA